MKELIFAILCGLAFAWLLATIQETNDIVKKIAKKLGIEEDEK